MMYIRLFTQPLSQFAQAFQNLQRCAAAAERVFGFLEEPEMDAEPTKAELGVLMPLRARHGRTAASWRIAALARMPPPV